MDRLFISQEELRKRKDGRPIITFCINERGIRGSLEVYVKDFGHQCGFNIRVRFRKGSKVVFDGRKEGDQYCDGVVVETPIGCVVVLRSIDLHETENGDYYYNTNFNRFDVKIEGF